MHQEDRLFSPIVHHNKHCAEFLVNGNGSFLTHWLSVAMITTATALVQYLNTQVTTVTNNLVTCITQVIAII